MSAVVKIPTIKIGEANVSQIGYGAMGISVFYGAADPDEKRLQLLDHLWERGERHIDTARLYGDSEELIGKWLKLHPERRSELFLATKFGFTDEFGVDCTPEAMRKQWAVSEKNLGTYVDLYYAHRIDPKVPIEETVLAMKELVTAGKVKYLGLSECSPNTLRRANAVHPISAVQVEYSPIILDIEGPGGVLETCRELNIPVVAYSPTARGILTSRYKSPEDFAGDFRASIPKYSAENWPKIQALIDGLQTVGKRHKATAAQVSIAWLVSQGTIPIPGSKQVKYCDENLEAANVKLTAEDLKEIRELIDQSNQGIAGERYGGGLMDQINVETPPYKG